MINFHLTYNIILRYSMFYTLSCISQLDIPLSEAFYKWMLGTESTFTAQDLQHVDPVLANSFSQLAAVAVKKHTLESDPLLVRIP